MSEPEDKWLDKSSKFDKEIDGDVDDKCGPPNESKPDINIPIYGPVKPPIKLPPTNPRIPVPGKNFHLEFNTFTAYSAFMYMIQGNQQEKDKLYSKALNKASNKLVQSLKKAALLLKTATNAVFPLENKIMASVVLDELAVQIAGTVGAMESATVFINGIANKIAEAVAKAVENGASEAQLAPFNELGDALQEKAANLTSAIVNSEAAELPADEDEPPVDQPGVVDTDSGGFNRSR